MSLHDASRSSCSCSFAFAAFLQVYSCLQLLVLPTTLLYCLPLLLVASVSSLVEANGRLVLQRLVPSKLVYTVLSTVFLSWDLTIITKAFGRTIPVVVVMFINDLDKMPIDDIWSLCKGAKQNWEIFPLFTSWFWEPVYELSVSLHVLRARKPALTCFTSCWNARGLNF